MKSESYKLKSLTEIFTSKSIPTETKEFKPFLKERDRLGFLIGS